MNNKGMSTIEKIGFFLVVIAIIGYGYNKAREDPEKNITEKEAVQSTITPGGASKLQTTPMNEDSKLHHAVYYDISGTRIGLPLAFTESKLSTSTQRIFEGDNTLVSFFSLSSNTPNMSEWKFLVSARYIIFSAIKVALSSVSTSDITFSEHRSEYFLSYIGKFSDQNNVYYVEIFYQKNIPDKILVSVFYSLKDDTYYYPLYRAYADYFRPTSEEKLFIKEEDLQEKVNTYQILLNSLQVFIKENPKQEYVDEYDRLKRELSIISSEPR